MKINLPVVDQEVTFASDAQLISTTDLKGVITFVNDEFVQVSGFSRDELIGKSHNIVRHPDMPTTAFADLWATIKDGRSWKGLVKNRCKDGRYYWVDAFVSPITSDGKITGYQSVRTLPTDANKRRAQEVFARWNKNADKPATFCPLLPYQAKLWLFYWLPNLLGAGVLSWFYGWPPALLILLLSTLGFALLYWLLWPVERALEYAKKTANNPAMRYVYTGIGSELGVLQYALQMRTSELRAVVSRLENTGRYLLRVNEISSDSLKGARDSVASQGAMVSQVVNAVDQLVDSQADIGQTSTQMAQSSAESQQLAEDGRQVIERLMSSISSLAEDLQQAKDKVNATAQRSDDIGGVLDVITEVAEQTNLLALNAAIEAARAGESGRGFAVVADEVRKLAQRTNDSASEIQSIIHELQTESRQSSDAIEAGVSSSQQTLTIAGEVNQELAQVIGRVEQISQLASNIDSSIQTQSALSEQTKNRMLDLSESANSAIAASDEMQEQGRKLEWHIASLNSLARHFLSTTMRK